jgi:hypothetical protein
MSRVEFSKAGRWFEHRHYWCTRDVNTIAAPTGGVGGVLRLEECNCGAVRTIEYRPGSDPIVRMVPANFVTRDAR